MEWLDRDKEFVSKRYDRIAGFITLFEWLFFLPRGLRKEAVARIGLKPGDRVLEVGCGTGRNLTFLQNCVGSTGHVYGVDLSHGMLARARRLCTQQRLANVTLTEGDALDYVPEEPLDGALFSLSYNTMPDHYSVLTHVLAQLRPGAQLVIMDAKLPTGPFGPWVLRFAVWCNRLTVLGNPHIQPWRQLAPLVDNFAMQERLFGAYYICWGRKRCEKENPHKPSEYLNE